MCLRGRPRWKMVRYQRVGRCSFQAFGIARRCHRNKLVVELTASTAAICATSFASPRRSSRAMSGSCSDSGNGQCLAGRDAPRLRSRNGLPVAPRVPFNDVFCHLLHEQRHAVGPARHMHGHVGRQIVASGDPFHHLLNLRMRQSVELQLRNVETWQGGQNLAGMSK